MNFPRVLMFNDSMDLARNCYGSSAIALLYSMFQQSKLIVGVPG